MILVTIIVSHFSLSTNTTTNHNIELWRCEREVVKLKSSFISLLFLHGVIALCHNAMGMVTLGSPINSDNPIKLMLE